MIMSWINIGILYLIGILPRWIVHPFAKTYVAGETIEKTKEMLILPTLITYLVMQQPHYPEIYFQILPTASPSVCEAF